MCVLAATAAAQVIPAVHSMGHDGGESGLLGKRTQTTGSSPIQG